MKVCNKKPVMKTKRPKAAGAKGGRAGGTKRRRRSGCGGRCMKPGPIVRNPYLNFLRKFRKENCGLSPIETIRKGARAWKSLSVKEKLGYIKEAFYAPKRHLRGCYLVCKKKPSCGKGLRKGGKQKRGHGKRRSRKPKANRSKVRKSRSKVRKSRSKVRKSRSKVRRSRSKARQSSSKPTPSPSKGKRSRSRSRRGSSKSRPKKAGFACK